MPELGRFVEIDPNKGSIYTQLSLNYYIHCYNNPLSYVDWDGHIPMSPSRQVPDPMGSLNMMYLNHIILASNFNNRVIESGNIAQVDQNPLVPTGFTSITINNETTIVFEEVSSLNEYLSNVLAGNYNVVYRNARGDLYADMRYLNRAFGLTQIQDYVFICAEVVSEIQNSFDNASGKHPNILSERGMELLKMFEVNTGTDITTSFRGLDAQNLTIGFGHAIRDTPEGRQAFIELIRSLGGQVEVLPNGHLRITEEIAVALFNYYDLPRFQNSLNNFIERNQNLNLTQHQYDALIMFSYNRGPHVWDFRHYDIVQTLQSGIWTDQQIMQQLGYFMMVRNGEGILEPAAGLWRRRMIEAHLFNTGEYRYLSFADLESMGLHWDGGEGWRWLG